MFPGCASHEDASGNSMHGFAIRRYGFVALTPQLVLHGFSSAGCAVDGALGGGLTYAVPLRPALWLVAGAGFFGTPPHAGLAAQQRGDLRLDLIQQRGDGQSVSVGLGQRGVNFGATW
jgi:hypothetical protein